MDGEEFRYLRLRLGLTQAGFGRLIGAREQAVARWEKGRARVPESAARLGLLLASGEPAVVHMVELMAQRTDGPTPELRRVYAEYVDYKRARGARAASAPA